MTKHQIQYIKKRVDKFGNIDIYTGKLSKHQEVELSKHFKVERGFLGYTNFKALKEDN